MQKMQKMKQHKKCKNTNVDPLKETLPLTEKKAPHECDRSPLDTIVRARTRQKLPDFYTDVAAGDSANLRRMNASLSCWIDRSFSCLSCLW